MPHTNTLKIHVFSPKGLWHAERHDKTRRMRITVAQDDYRFQFDPPGFIDDYELDTFAVPTGPAKLLL